VCSKGVKGGNVGESELTQGVLKNGDACFRGC